MQCGIVDFFLFSSRPPKKGTATKLWSYGIENLLSSEDGVIAKILEAEVLTTTSLWSCGISFVSIWEIYFFCWSWRINKSQLIVGFRWIMHGVDKVYSSNEISHGWTQGRSLFEIFWCLAWWWWSLLLVGEFTRAQNTVERVHKRSEVFCWSLSDWTGSQ
jgi:hypothetical protein